MSKMIQLRNVPEKLHRKLKARAATEGRSLSEYLLSHIQELAERPTMEELQDRLRRREPVSVDVSPADVLRQERNSR
jgi:plasmid stability protein